LNEGARVALVAPAGPLRGDGDLARAVDNVRSFGWEPVVGEHALARDGYFAGPDAQRVADLNAALRDETIDAVWCLRGGYGAMRILERIDYEAMARRPKPFIGYSDITALHAAFSIRSDVVTYHGPTARAVLSGFSRASLACALVHGGDSCGEVLEARVLRAGSASGTLAGGNLALLSALTGTRFAPRLDGAILVLEDVNEAVYRIDRMLTQLKQSGILARARALVFGEMRGCEGKEGATVLDVIRAASAHFDGPVVAGFPSGHTTGPCWTLPLGVQVRVKTHPRPTIVVEEAPVR